MTILDTIDNKIGTFASASVVPSAGTSSVTVTSTMTTQEALDPSDSLRIGIEADFGLGFAHMAWSPIWTGGPGKTPPSFTWKFNPASPPQRVRAQLENITEVVGGLSVSFT
jgi:hypothetical protein